MNCALLMGFIAESHKMHGEWRVNLGNLECRCSVPLLGRRFVAVPVFKNRTQFQRNTKNVGTANTPLLVPHNTHC
jgi:hypothetical protein